MCFLHLGNPGITDSFLPVGDTFSLFPRQFCGDAISSEWEEWREEERKKS